MHVYEVRFYSVERVADSYVRPQSRSNSLGVRKNDFTRRVPSYSGVAEKRDIGNAHPDWLARFQLTASTPSPPGNRELKDCSHT